MTQDEIIDMARQAVIYRCDSWRLEMLQEKNALEAFAKLVAAKEREECADLLEFGYIDDENHHLQYAYEIRARGEQA